MTTPKTHLQIAQYLWNDFNERRKELGERFPSPELHPFVISRRAKCEQHLADCKRELKFLKDYIYDEGAEHCECGICLEIKREVSDLQSAIKFYEEKGVGK